eukprot:TRINITY_DN36851_c0_g1_i1.p1 TRINITY_DN36851_c0_g1~~TRINITY_DN36851_c0_g1_i1.p1  ORF type:complete len:391 (+),score=67.48 TRINITY_DN36851_c0_g1_i1:129-1301(+)
MHDPLAPWSQTTSGRASWTGQKAGPWFVREVDRDDTPPRRASSAFQPQAPDPRAKADKESTGGSVRSTGFRGAWRKALKVGSGSNAAGSSWPRAAFQALKTNLGGAGKGPSLRTSQTRTERDTTTNFAALLGEAPDSASPLTRRAASASPQILHNGETTLPRRPAARQPMATPPLPPVSPTPLLHLSTHPAETMKAVGAAEVLALRPATPVAFVRAASGAADVREGGAVVDMPRALPPSREGREQRPLVGGFAATMACGELLSEMDVHAARSLAKSVHFLSKSVEAARRRPKPDNRGRFGRPPPQAAYDNALDTYQVNDKRLACFHGFDRGSEVADNGWGAHSRVSTASEASSARAARARSQDFAGRAALLGERRASPTTARYYPVGAWW